MDMTLFKKGLRIVFTIQLALLTVRAYSTPLSFTSLLDPILTDPKLVNSGDDPELVHFKNYLRGLHQTFTLQEKRAKKEGSQTRTQLPSVYFYDPAVNLPTPQVPATTLPPLTDRPVNGGAAFFQDTQTLTAINDQLAAFNAKGEVRVLVCSGRYYLPPSVFPLQEGEQVAGNPWDMRSLEELARTAQKSATGTPTIVEDAFHMLMGKYLQAVEAEFGNKKLIILFGFEYIESSLVIEGTLNSKEQIQQWTTTGPASGTIQTDFYFAEYLAVDQQLSAQSAAHWFASPTQVVTRSVNADRTPWLKDRVETILKNTTAVLSLQCNGDIYPDYFGKEVPALKAALAANRSVETELSTIDWKKTHAHLVQIPSQRDGKLPWHGPLSDQLSEEINEKLHCLQVAKGYQMYVITRETNCLPTQQQTDQVRDHLLAGHALDAKKTILVVALLYRPTAVSDLNTPYSQSFVGSIYLGDQVAEAASIRSILQTGLEQADLDGLARSIIQTYKSIPKPRLEYTYIITKAPERRQVLAKTYSNGQAMVYLPRLGTIISLPASRSKTLHIGNAIEAVYYVIEQGKPKLVSGVRNLKERYVSEEGERFGALVASKAANWELVELTKQTTYVRGGLVINSEKTTYQGPEIEKCRYEYGPPCTIDASVENALDWSSMALSPLGWDVVPDAMGAVYFTFRGQKVKATIYAVSATSPVVAAPVMKAGLASLGAGWLMLVKRWDNQVLHLVMANADEAVPAAAKALFDNHGIQSILYTDDVYGQFLIKAQGNEVLTCQLLDDGSVIVLDYVDNAAEQVAKLSSGSGLEVQKHLAQILGRTAVEAAQTLLSRLLVRLKNELKWSEDLIGAFEKDFKDKADLLAGFDSKVLDVEAWQLLQAQPSNRVKYEALQAVSQLLQLPGKPVDMTLLMQMEQARAALAGKVKDVLKGKMPSVEDFYQQVSVFLTTYSDASSRKVVEALTDGQDINCYVVYRFIEQINGQGQKVVFADKWMEIAKAADAIPTKLVDGTKVITDYSKEKAGWYVVDEQGRIYLTLRDALAKLAKECPPCYTLTNDRSKIRDAMWQEWKKANPTKIRTDFDKLYTDWEAHHLIPIEALEESEIMKFYFNNCTSCLDFNGLVNGKMLATLRIGGTHGGHPKYNDQIIEYLNSRIYSSSTSRKIGEIQQDIDFILYQTQKRIDDLPTVKLNELDLQLTDTNFNAWLSAGKPQW